eukprot:TRINITY_DN8029_c0_g7_i1.p2 TRINITY_DN8029_c0_g7~~TRINITY_DN8029_c0_g7_i1.p2  ORF type:complete len:112 (+),score=12.41 TRINITY_DN8029_c0_g7_i1:119-454(+)
MSQGVYVGVGSQMATPLAFTMGPRQIYDRTQMVSWTDEKEPMNMQCPRCNQTVVTKVNYEIGSGNHAMAFLTCAVGGVAGCFLLPYLIDDCKDAVHVCPHCGTRLGIRFVM